MPLLPADQITLPDAEKGILEAIVRAHTTAKQIALRAQIILLADEGVGVRETMRRLGTWDNIVRRWRKRWRARVHETRIVQRLADEPRPGKPPTITPEQICRIVALACQPPDLDGGPPLTHWSYSALVAEAVRRGIIETISPASVGRILRRSRPQAAPQPLLAQPKAG